MFEVDPDVILPDELVTRVRHHLGNGSGVTSDASFDAEAQLKVLENQSRDLHLCWYLPEIQIGSHRRILGPAAIFYQKVARWLLGWYVEQRWGKQSDFNGKIAHALSESLRLHRLALGWIGELQSSFREEVRREKKAHEALAQELALLREVHEGLHRHVAKMESEYTELALLREAHERLRRYVAKMESEHVELTKTVAALREENFALSARLRQRPQPVAMTAAPGVEPPPALATDLIDYVLFEYRFRGSREAIAEHFQRFVGFFGRGGRVLDIGCGRGEMVELLCARGCDVLGIDLDEGMVADCVERGLPVTQADAIIHLGSCENASLDGVFCSQVIEHLTTTRWAELMDVARRKLRPNGCLVIETVNPGSFYALAHAFYKDLTHVRPIHPEALQFVARSQGWRDTKLLMLSPHPLLEGSEGRDPAVNALVDTVFGHMDYALVAYR